MKMETEWLTIIPLPLENVMLPVPLNLCTVGPEVLVTEWVVCLPGDTTKIPLN